MKICWCFYQSSTLSRFVKRFLLFVFPTKHTHTLPLSTSLGLSLTLLSLSPPSLSPSLSLLLPLSRMDKRENSSRRGSDDSDDQAALIDDTWDIDAAEHFSDRADRSTDAANTVSTDMQMTELHHRVLDEQDGDSGSDENQGNDADNSPMLETATGEQIEQRKKQKSFVLPSPLPSLTTFSLPFFLSFFLSLLRICRVHLICASLHWSEHTHAHNACCGSVALVIGSFCWRR